MALFSYDILVELKNTDLHALSAYEAITDMMAFTSLIRLKRYRRLEITLDANSQADGQKAVEGLIQNSFVLLNPNKERYTVYQKGSAMLTHNALPGQHVICVDVKAHHTPDWSATLSTLNHKAAINITQLNAHIMWELIVADDRPRDTVLQDIAEKVVYTTSRKNGLLANPLYEDVALR